MEYVYIVKSLNLHKIGKTKSLKQRLRSGKTFNPFGIDLVMKITTKYSDKIEKYLHEQFKSKRVSGEWFELDGNDLERIETLISKKYGSSQILKYDINTKHDNTKKDEEILYLKKYLNGLESYNKDLAEERIRLTQQLTTMTNAYLDTTEKFNRLLAEAVNVDLNDDSVFDTTYFD